MTPTKLIAPHEAKTLKKLFRECYQIAMAIEGQQMTTKQQTELLKGKVADIDKLLN